MSLVSENSELPAAHAAGGLLPDRDLFSLGGPVGRSGDNDRADVIKAQILLGNTGYYDLAGLGAPTGWAGGGLDDAIRRFQTDHGLAPDGLLLPLAADGIGRNGEGETLAALQTRVGPQLQGHAAPTPEEVDAHYAARARGGDAMADVPGIATADGAAGAGRYPLGVLSDAPAAVPVMPKPGQQVAQVATPPVTGLWVGAAPPAGQVTYGATSEDDDAPPPSPYPQEAPLVKAAAREIEKRFGYARDNLRSLLEAARDLQGGGRQPSPGPGPGEAGSAAFVTPPALPAVPPSRPAGAAEQKAGETPPLAPPAIDGGLHGRPADMPDIPDEKLIPPELQDWYGGLEPFDQELAKELLLVFSKAAGRRGLEATRLGNADTVKEILDYFATQRPDLRPNLTHVYGGREDGNPAGDELREEYLKGRDSRGPVGASWPDMTIMYLVEGTEPEYLRVFTGKTLKGDPRTGIKSERDQLARAEYNRPGEMMAFAPKLLADRPGGSVSPEVRAAYRSVAQEIAAEIGQRFEALLKAKGKL